jgi:excisionase family DNA binding protein
VLVTIHPVAEPRTDDDLLTLQEAAEALDVHYMTAYRWVRQGDLPAVKDGGRLRVRRDDLDACRRARQDDRDDHDGRAEDARQWQVHVDRLLQQLVNGEASEANTTVRQLVKDGLSVADLYTQVLTPALHRIGDMWEVGAISIAVEHRATAITSGIMSRLSEHFERRGPRRGVAATVTAPGEAHGVATAMIADFLRAAGWEVHHLGTDVPIDDLKLFLDIVPADVVCVSVAKSMDPEEYRALADACEGRQLIMGGQGVDLAIAEPLGITVLDDPRQLVDHLEAHAPDRA